jgi:hypothetical protein
MNKFEGIGVGVVVVSQQLRDVVGRNVIHIGRNVLR